MGDTNKPLRQVNPPIDFDREMDLKDLKINMADRALYEKAYAALRRREGAVE